MMYIQEAPVVLFVLDYPERIGYMNVIFYFIFTLTHFIRKKQMKKVLSLVLIGLFSAGVAVASDFETSQQKKVDKIAGKIEKNKDNEQIVTYLTEKSDCVKAATDAAGIKACVEKFPPEKLAEMATPVKEAVKAAE